MALIRIRPGRSLQWSPDWPCSDLSVLFDGSAGDYWVLTPQARGIVHLLAAEGPLELADLSSRLCLDAEGVMALLEDLARSGIITAPTHGAPAETEPAVDTID